MASAGAYGIPPQRQTHQQILNRAVASILGRQWGVIGRRQLIEVGMGVEAIRYRIAAGLLTEVFPGA